MPRYTEGIHQLQPRFRRALSGHSAIVRPVTGGWHRLPHRSVCQWRAGRRLAV